MMYTADNIDKCERQAVEYTGRDGIKGNII